MRPRQIWLLLLLLSVFTNGHTVSLQVNKTSAADTKNRPRPVKTSKGQPTPDTYRDCANCPEMVLVPSGTFMMGSASSDQEGQDYEKPRHELKVAQFALGKFEISKSQFSEFIDATGYKTGDSCWTMEDGKGEMRNQRNWLNPGYLQENNHPVTCVSIDDAEAYIKWLNQKTGKHYRLPTEAEWEYAARAGTSATRYWGDEADNACQYANVADLTLQRAGWKMTPHKCEDDYVYTSPIGNYKPNAFGLFDMLGNVWEWTCSFDSGYGSSEEEKCTDLLSRRIYRGGSWINVPDYVRSSSRYGYIPSGRFNNLGFRLAHDR